MSSGDKLLERMRANPRDWKIADVATLCAQCGIECSSPGSGSHFKVKHANMVEILTIPAKRPIKPISIRELVRFVDRVRKDER